MMVGVVGKMASLLQSAGSWWWRSLLGWLPARWRHRWQSIPARVLVKPVAAGFEIWLEKDGSLTRLGYLPQLSSTVQLDALAMSAGRHLPRWWWMPADQVLRRKLRFPVAALPRLDAVVGFEVDRQTPFTPEQVHQALRVIAVDKEHVTVELVVTPRNMVASALAAAGPVGAALTGIDTDDGNALLGINMLPNALRARRHYPRWSAAMVLCWIAGVCLLALTATQWLDNRKAAIAQLEGQLQVKAGLAREAAGQRESLAGLVAGVQFFEEQRNTYGTTVELLEELGRRIPDGSRLERLSVTGGQLQLMGVSDQAAALVGLLDGSHLWQRPSLSGVLQADPGSRQERFTLSAELTGYTDVAGAAHAR